MKSTLALFCLLVPLAGGAQSTAKPPTAPAIPRSTADLERSALVQAELDLSKGRFDFALKQVSPLIIPAVVRVFVDWAPVPVNLRPVYRPLMVSALSQWNSGLGGSARFEATQAEDTADVVILFEQSVTRSQFGQSPQCCLDGICAVEAAAGAAAPRRAARVRISLREPYKETPHTAASMSHLFGQALGLYLGLKSSDVSQGIMGPDTHGSPTDSAVAPSQDDLRDALALNQARNRLSGYANRKISIYLPRAVLVVESTTMEAGDVQRGDTPHFVFNVRNTGDALLEIGAKPHCGCTVATFDKTIAPGATGKIEADLHTADFRGRVQKMIEVDSNDPENAKIELHINANIISRIAMLPTETPIIGLKETGATTDDMRIEIADAEPVQIVRALCSVPYASATVETASTGKNAYALKLTVGPDAPEGRSVFMVTINTTSRREAQTTFFVTCEKGILIQPPTVYMGTITSASVLPIHQMVTLTRRGNPFKIRKIKLADAGVHLRQEALPDGDQYRIFLDYTGGWPAGQIERKIVVETDDTTRPIIEISVTGTVVSGK